MNKYLWNIKQADGKMPKISLVKIQADGKINVKLTNNEIIYIPKNYTQRLREAKIQQLKKYTIHGDGIGLSFPDINEDINVLLVK